MKNCLLLLAGLSLGWMISSCEYDNEETLYPPEPCDTTMVTYSLTVSPIIAQHCLSLDCHGSPAEVSGIPLDGYDNLKQVVDSERLLGAIRHETGFSFMPKNTDKLPDCDISKIERWVANGAPNN
jgi:hypothetical protein